MGHSRERQEVMLAHAEDLDVADHHEVVGAAFVGERPGEVAGRVGAEAGEDLAVGARDPVGSIAQPVALGIFADRDQDLAHGAGDAGFVEGAVPRSAALGDRRRGARGRHAGPISTPQRRWMRRRLTTWYSPAEPTAT